MFRGLVKGEMKLRQHGFPRPKADDHFGAGCSPLALKI